MKTLYFNDIESLCCDIADRYDSQVDEYDDISVIAKYTEAKEIVKELLCMGYDIASIDLHREEFNEYWDEYIISLNFDGVWCEKFKRSNGYFNDVSEITYISNECNSACIPYVKSKEIYAFEIGVPEDRPKSDESNSAIHYSTDKDGETHGFSVSKSDGNSYKSYSFYTTENLNKDIIGDLLKSFGFNVRNHPFL